MTKRFTSKKTNSAEIVGAGLIPPFSLFAIFAVIEWFQCRFGGKPDGNLVAGSFIQRCVAGCR